MSGRAVAALAGSHPAPVALHQDMNIPGELARSGSTEPGFEAPLLTLFPYCMTWLVLVWDFTSWYCLWRVSLVKSSCKSVNSEVLQPSELEGEASAEQPAPWRAHHVRVFHPVDAVPVPQVGGPLLIVVTGIG